MIEYIFSNVYFAEKKGFLPPYKMISCFSHPKVLCGIEMMTRHLRVYSTLAKELISVPSTHMGWLTTHCNFSFLGIKVLCSLWRLYSYTYTSTQIHTCIHTYRQTDMSLKLIFSKILILIWYFFTHIDRLLASVSHHPSFLAILASILISFFTLFLTTNLVLVFISKSTLMWSR